MPANAPMRLDPVSLRLFVSVCEEGTIMAAADREHIAASAISKRIAEMEEWIGTKLLTRGQRGVCPTPAGEALLRQGRQILGSMHRLQSRLREYGQGIQGHVRVLANMASMAEFAPDEIAAFVAAHPGIAVSLEERRNADVVMPIAEGRADIGITRDFVPMRELTAIPLRRDRFAVVVDRGHPLAPHRELSFRDTLGYERVGIALDTSLPASLHTQMCMAAATAGVDLIHRVQVSGYDAALRLVRGSRFVTVIPAPAAARLSAARDLVVIPLTDPWAVQQFVLCCRPGIEDQTPAVRQMLDFLITRAAQEAAGH